MALDEPEATREWLDAAAVTFPAVVDPDHLVAERYGFVNVPSAVWIDEDDRIVRPADLVPATDMWRDFSGIDASVHHDALRRWVRDGEPPMSPDEVRARLLRPTAEEQEARVHRRLGAWLVRHGRAGDATAHFERADALAPGDWTIRRGTMPLRDLDPFGQPFFDFIAEWQERGRPGYGWGNSLEVPTPPD